VQCWNGLNLVGLQRRGVTRAYISSVAGRRFRMLAQGEALSTTRARRLGEETGSDYVRRSLDFVLADTGRHCLLTRLMLALIAGGADWPQRWSTLSTAFSLRLRGDSAGGWPRSGSGLSAWQPSGRASLPRGGPSGFSLSVAAVRAVALIVKARGRAIAAFGAGVPKALAAGVTVLACSC